MSTRRFQSPARFALATFLVILNGCGAKSPGPSNLSGQNVQSKQRDRGIGGITVSSGSGSTVVAPPPTTGAVPCDRKILAALAGRIGGAITGSANAIRSKLGRHRNAGVLVLVGVRIDSSASASITSITSGGQSLTDVVSIELGGVQIPTPEVTCTGTIPVKISEE